MSGNSNTSNILNEYLCFAVHSSGMTAIKRDFTMSIQAALRSGLKPEDLQAILNAVLSSEVGAKEAQ